MGGKVPTVVFNNGQRCPIVGLGTWKAEPGVVTEAVSYAIDFGYRHFDCAYFYMNEKEVGNGINAKIKEGVVSREQVFVTSKLWNTFHRNNLVLPALRESLSNLGLDYLDLYLMHWPIGFKEGGDLMPKNECGKVLYSDTSFTETWSAMEECQRLGIVKAIGVSNFNIDQLRTILDIAEIPPSNNQVELHPYLPQKELVRFCHEEGVTVTAYRPLGGAQGHLMEDPLLLQVAATHGKTPAQVLIRYHVERGVIVIAKSTNKDRLKSNLQVFDFSLSPEDMALLDSLQCNVRYSPLQFASDHKDYPFI